MLSAGVFLGVPREWRKDLRRAAAVGALLLSTLSCGYKLAGANRFLPEHIRTIAIPVFENQTPRAEIEQRITEKLLDEFIRRGRYKTQADPAGADAVLEGTVMSYTTQPVTFTTRGRASRMEVTVLARVLLTDLKTHTVIWSQDHFVFRGQYDIPERAEGRDFFDREIIAIDQIARDFARTIVTSILEGF